VLSLWSQAVLDGRCAPDDAAAAVRGADVRHLVVGWPGTEAFDLDALPGLLRRTRIDRIAVAVPGPGDPVGLAGPPAFNADALDAGEAMVVTAGDLTLGLVPHADPRAILWQVGPALPPAPLDPGEATRDLRSALVRTTADLVRLDVASWNPEIPDLLLNLDHREPLALPRGSDVRVRETLDRADLCREIVALALDDDGGAVTAAEMADRRRCLSELDRSARRAIAAVCSASLALS
jgi:hypothetical protein